MLYSIWMCVVPSNYVFNDIISLKYVYTYKKIELSNQTMHASMQRYDYDNALRVNVNSCVSMKRAKNEP